jgi:long-subunit fatty acid transport protein
MKKQFLLITSLVLITTVAYSGGIVTNSNQSAYWVRTLVRDAAIGPDAVYFNPAGLTRLDDGFHFSLNSQTIFQNKDVRNDYVFLSPSPKKYKGEIKVPVFPSIYATWKKNKIAVSFGFNPIGGGGGAEYKKGLPMFETQISNLVPLLQSSLDDIDAGLSQPAAYNFDPMFRNITGYNADIYFKGTSMYLGYQLGVTYSITDIFSAYIGGRLVTAKNTYEGNISNVSISAAPAEQGNTGGLYDLPAGDYTPGNYLRGVSDAVGVTGMADAILQGTAAALDIATADVEVDAEEQGTGFAPILGLNISPSDNLNIGLKYEFKTKMDLTTTVNDNKGGPLFINDSVVHSDVPAMFSVGIWYKIIPSLSATAGFHYYFDKSANYGKTSDLTGEEVDNDKVIDKNYFEIGLSLEYSITEKFLVSAGYLYAKPGVSTDYQSEMSFALPSSTVGFGFGFKFTEKIMANLGASYSMYAEEDKTLTDINTNQNYTNTFFKSNLILGLGLDISF